MGRRRPPHTTQGASYVFPFINLTKVNVANVNQSHHAFGQNIAIGSAGVTQTLVQLQNNAAAINQG
jgi:hypothetical protein